MYHFTLTGSIDDVTDKVASDKMTTISPKWEKEDSIYGVLYLGVYDWKYSNDNEVFQLHIPKLRTGGEIEKNETASSFFGFQIYGNCFLKENNEGAKKIKEL